jgi:hypothetical protein
VNDDDGINEDKHPCFKQDSNPQTQRPCDQGLRLRPRSHWDQLDDTEPFVLVGLSVSKWMCHILVTEVLIY